MKIFLKTLRRESYHVIQQAKQNNNSLYDMGRKMNILPASHRGSPRDMKKQYYDALAIMRTFKSKPIYS